jgi:hypothetical protein
VRLWGLVVALAGCGRFDFDPLRDGGRDGSLGADAAPDAPCAFGSWSTPVQIPMLSSSAADFGGQVTADGLGYYFQSGRSGSQQLYVSHRADRQSTWSMPVLISELDTTNEQIEAAPSDGELEIYFTSTRPTGDAQCIWHADRATTANAFGDIVELDQLCMSGRLAAGPYASLDGLVLYYNTFEAPPFGTIYESHRASRADTFDVGTPVPGLGTVPNGYPYVTPDALTAYYEALGTGNGHHLYVATRDSVGSAFGPPVPIPNVDDDSDNEDVSLTADGFEIFFASARASSSGDKDIFTAARACN